MFPAQALAEELLARGWRVKLSTDARGARYAGGFPDAVEIEVVPSATTARGGLKGKLAAPFKILAGAWRARASMKRDRPAIVVGFGGYPSIPALLAATRLKLPTLIHEQNGVPGRVNRLFASRVDGFACGVWPTDLPDGVEGYFTGNPVRSAVLARAGAGYIPPGDYPMALLVIGGSQGARILSDVVPGAVASLPEDLLRNLRVEHQARGEDEERVRAFYDQHGISAEVAPFFEDIARRISEAQLVISRAGASSVADLAIIGRPSILVPFAAAAGDHQTANARALSGADAAIVIPESKLTEATLADAIETILSQPDAAQRMARSAQGVGRPEAAQDLADLATQIAGLDIYSDERAEQP